MYVYKYISSVSRVELQYFLKLGFEIECPWAEKKEASI